MVSVILMPMEKPRAGHWFAEPKRGDWTYSPLKVRSRTLWCIGLAPLVVIVALAHATLPSWLALGLAGLVGAKGGEMFDLVIGPRRNRRIGPDDLAFLDHELGLGEHLVELVAMSGENCLGVDRGIVAFDEGLIWFNGSATSFALAAGDFRLRGKFDLRDPYLWLPKDALLLRTGNERDSIRLIGLGGDRQELARDLNRFFHRGQSVQGSRQWPPFESYRVPAESLKPIAALFRPFVTVEKPRPLPSSDRSDALSTPTHQAE